MKVEVVSGQPGVDINQFFTELLDKNGINVGDIKQEHFMIYQNNRSTEYPHLLASFNIY